MSGWEASGSQGGRISHIHGRLWCNGDHPAARRGPKADPQIEGVVFEVTAGQMQKLDIRKGVASDWYRRVKVPTVEGELVWMYEGRRCLTEPYTCGTQRRRQLQLCQDGVLSWDESRPEAHAWRVPT